MAEINNSLAASIQPLDIGKSLLTAGQINALRTKSSLEEAETAQTQQNTQYNQFLQNRPGAHGLRPEQENTLADAAGKRADLRGRAANEIVTDPSDAGVQRAFKHFDQNGTPIDPETQSKIMSMPPAQRRQVAQQIQSGSMPSSLNIEQSGVPAGNRTREEGNYVPESLDSSKPYSNRTAIATGSAGQPSQAKVDDAIKNGRNFDGSRRVLSTADITGTQQPNFNDRFKGDMFTPGIVRGPDGTLSSSVTPATQALQAQAAEQYKAAGVANASAQGLSMRLDMMEHSADVLNKEGWSSTGAGANAKLGAAKSVNALLQSVGLKPAVDPNKIANWEDLNKETTRAGFDLAKTLGSQQAAVIVQSSVGAVPGAENTKMGFKLVTSGIRQAIQREKDFYNFATEYAQLPSHRGNTFGADVEFNKQNPPEKYSKTAIVNALPSEAVNDLKKNPKLADHFDEKYGAGLASFILKRAD